MAIFRQKKDHKAQIFSFLAGILLLVIGFVNTFWGNDPFFGLAIVFGSGLYLWPTVISSAERWHPTGVNLIKILVFLVLVWAALGVGELDDKVDMMVGSFPMPNITGI
jgi:hypothetical protein